MMTFSEDQIALAAEYALGTLDASERAQVDAAMANDPDFAAVVAAHPEVEGPWADVAAELALAAGDRDRAARLRIARMSASPMP